MPNLISGIKFLAAWTLLCLAVAPKAHAQQDDVGLSPSSVHLYDLSEGDSSLLPVKPEYNRTRLAQKTLLAGGFKIGKVDGAWGGNTREAVNRIRREAGLKNTRNLRPYSRMLIFNRPEAPKVGALPRPGTGVISVDARRAFLAGRPDIREAYCTGGGGVGLTDKLPRIIQVGPEGLVSGQIADEQPWYQSVARSYLLEHNRCLAGVEASCQNIVDNLGLFIHLWGMRPSIERDDPAFENLAAQSNIALNAMVNAYITARATIEVKPSKDEAIIDWLFGTVTNYKRVVRRSEELPDFMRYGHSGGQLSVLPVLSMAALIGDPNTFSEGIEFYEHALANTRVDGSLREDSQRGDMALMHEAATLSALMVTGLRAEQQGINLFNRSVKGRTIHDVAARVLSNLEDWDLSLRYAKARQDSFLDAVRVGTDPKTFYARDLENLLDWMVLYRERFPFEENTKRIQRLTFDERICGRLAARQGKAPWSCFRALSSFQISPKSLMPSPNGGLFTGFSPGCMMATRTTPFD